MKELLYELEELDTASVYKGDRNYTVLCSIIEECFRVLVMNSQETYEDILEKNVGDDTLLHIVEITDLKKELPIMEDLQQLYISTRALKPEGQLYTVLDTFFDKHLGRTL